MQKSGSIVPCTISTGPRKSTPRGRVELRNADLGLRNYGRCPPSSCSGGSLPRRSAWAKAGPRFGGAARGAIVTPSPRQRFIPGIHPEGHRGPSSLWGGAALGAFPKTERALLAWRQGANHREPPCGDAEWELDRCLRGVLVSPQEWGVCPRRSRGSIV